MKNKESKALQLCEAIGNIFCKIEAQKTIQLKAYQELDKEIQLVAKFLDLNSDLSCLIIAVLFNRRLLKGTSKMELSQLSSMFKCNLKDSVILNNELESLKLKRIIKLNKKEDNEITCYLTNDTIDAVLKGQNSNLKNNKNVKIENLLQAVNRELYKGIDDEEISSAISDCFEDFNCLREVKLIQNLKLNEVDRTILLFVILRRVIYKETAVALERIFRVALNDPFNRYYVKREFESGKNHLFTANILIYSASSNPKEKVEMHPEFIKKIKLKELGKEIDFTIDSNLITLINPNEIKLQTQMVYEQSTNIEFLDKILSTDGFISVSEKLKTEKIGENQLVAMLYGLSGTGKTQTVKNIAAKYNRPILQVNISQIKDPYIGISEKNISEVFVLYRKALEHFQRYDAKLKGFTGTPILYIDEFESLMPQRTAFESSPAGNMLTNMVGVFLTEIEKLQGILLLSTNIPSSIDSAFHRRINFKFNFGAYSKNSQRKAMKVYFHDMEEEILDSILNEIDLTPGNIVNMRKAFVLEEIFSDLTSTQKKKEALLAIAKREVILKEKYQPILGFKQTAI